MKDTIKKFFNDVTPDFIKNGIQSMFSFIELKSDEILESVDLKKAQSSTIDQYKKYAPVIGAIAIFSLIYIAFGLLIPLLKLATYGFGVGYAYTHLDDKLYPSAPGDKKDSEGKTAEHTDAPGNEKKKDPSVSNKGNTENNTESPKNQNGKAAPSVSNFSNPLSFIKNALPTAFTEFKITFSK